MATTPTTGAGGTLAQVNALLKARGAEERLTRGRGYCYFRGGAAMSWYTSSVYVPHPDAYSVTEWIELHAELSGAEPPSVPTSSGITRIIIATPARSPLCPACSETFENGVCCCPTDPGATLKDPSPAKAFGGGR